ncbi:MAG: serine protease [Marinilabiliales bacterium]|nr:MAG: serine protease [Marinilabiliales bacterium]
MYTSVWKNHHKSVCSFEFYSKRGILFYRATGFRYKDYIVTDICSEEMRRAVRLVLRFCPDSSTEPVMFKELNTVDLRKLIAGELKNRYSGIKLIRVPPGRTAPVPLAAPVVPAAVVTGTQVAIIGYSRRMNKPYLKAGIVSSHNIIGGDEYMHIEAPFEPGNAGSPVIDLSTGNIVGVVTDCLSSQLRDYRVLKSIIKENIRTLSKLNGSFNDGRTDFAQAIKANQYMAMNLARDIHLGCHRSYGFAAPFIRIARYVKAIGHEIQISVNTSVQEGY